MRILHCSDIHLGRRIVGASGEFSDIRFNDYFEAFSYIIDYATLNNIDVFVIAGDLFDKKEISPEILSRTETLLRKLNNANIKTLVIEGNHDKIKVGRENDSWINYLENKNLILRPHYFEESEEKINFNPLVIENVRFYGLGYPGFFVDEVLAMLADSIEIDDSYINYVIVHTAIANGDLMPGTTTHSAVKTLEGKAHYIAGGHFHEFSTYPKENPIFFVPGSPEMWDFGEYKQKKGFIIYDTESGIKEFVISQNRTKHLFNLNIDSENSLDANTRILEMTHEYEIETGSICYLNLELKHQVEPNLEDVEKLLLAKGAVKVFARALNKSIGSIDLSGFKNTVSEVELEIIATWDKFSKNKDFTMQFLQDMKRLQIELQQDDFIAHTDLFLDQMLTGMANDNK